VFCVITARCLTCATTTAHARASWPQRSKSLPPTTTGSARGCALSGQQGRPSRSEAEDPQAACALRLASHPLSVRGLSAFDLAGALKLASAGSAVVSGSRHARARKPACPASSPACRCMCFVTARRKRVTLPKKSSDHWLGACAVVAPGCMVAYDSLPS
jgi:hypothetical protein